jgi:ABC-2 type transport system permease protein
VIAGRPHLSRALSIPCGQDLRPPSRSRGPRSRWWPCSAWAPPANAVLALVALILGTVVFALLAAVSSAATRTVEMAQVTSLSVLVIPFVLSGLLIPVAMLPWPLRGLAQALPLTPVVELMRPALAGTAAGGRHLGLAATFSVGVIPVLVLTAWTAAAGWAARRWFCGEPRR